MLSEIYLKKEIFVICFYLLLTLLLNSSLLKVSTDYLPAPPTASISTETFKSFHLNPYPWLELLSQPIVVYIFTYRSFLVLLFPTLSPAQIGVLITSFSQFLAFFGMFLLAQYYLNYVFRKGNIIIPFVVGLFYGLNPSFFIGDYGWLDMKFAFALLPFIVLTFNKFIEEKKLRYGILCSILLTLNIDEHFLWFGYPLLLALISFFLFVIKLLKEKSIDFQPLLAFVFVISVFVGIELVNIILKLTKTSSYQLSLTKAGVDVCWSNAFMLNMLRAASHMDLPSIYSPSNYFFLFFNSLMSLTLLIPIFSFTSLLFYKKNQIVIFYGILLLVLILPFFVGSPFKRLHYWLFFNTPFGPLIRTWRVIDAYIALSLSVLMTFSLYYLFEKFSNKRKYLILPIIIGLIFTSLIYSWPLFTGDVNGRLTPIKVPDEYFEAYSFLSNQTGNNRVMYVPEFVYSGGQTSTLKPFWSPKVGVIHEFLTFSSPKPTFWQVGWWGHFYDFTLSPFYYSLLRLNSSDTLSHFLQWANIKYVVIHNDIPSLEEAVKNYINFLNSSNYFRLVFHKNFTYIFENILSGKRIEALPQTILVDGGYRVIDKFYKALNNSNLNYGFIFLDQGIPLNLLDSIRLILTDKPTEQLINDLLFTMVSNKNSTYVIYPYQYVIDHEPNKKWSRASYLDPHQQVWHPYVNWQDYAWDFDYMKGIAFTINSDDSFEVPFAINKSEEYVILLRLMFCDKCGEINVTIDNTSFIIKTLDDYNGFYWYKLELFLESNKHFIKVTNKKGFNAISAICIIPREDYTKSLQEVLDYLHSKQIIDLNVNIMENPSFEGSFIGWKMEENVIKDGKFRINLDDEVSYNGNFSLKVITNYTKTWYGWSWIRSNWVNVTKGEKYYLITHMRVENVNASHIVLEAYDQPNNRVFQLAQVPSAEYGSFDWRIYKYMFEIPENVTKIRIVLNAGWSNKNGSQATTWFDDIKLIPIKSKYKVINLPQKNETLLSINYSKINPTLWKVQVNATKPFMLSFAESYDPLWEARVYKDGKLVEKVKPVPLYGVINGFWINTTGDNLEIVIRYTPQDWFEIGLVISGLTFASSLFYLFYDWRRSKKDKWALALEKKISKIIGGIKHAKKKK